MVADAMLAAEVTLIWWPGRNVTKKSKASHLLEEEFVGFFVVGKTSCNIRCWSAKRLSAPANCSPRVGDVTHWQHGRGEAWQAARKTDTLPLSPVPPRRKNVYSIAQIVLLWPIGMLTDGGFGRFSGERERA